MSRTLALVIALILALSSCSSPPSAPRTTSAKPIPAAPPSVEEGVALTYYLAAPTPVDHYFDIRILLKGLSSSHVDFVMPAWSPGRYVIYDFARQVRDVEARAEGGLPLEIRRLDKQRWRVERRGREGIMLSYRVYADFLSGTFSQLNDAHANVNGASVFMYADGHQHRPIDLFLAYPQGDEWQVATSLKPVVPNRQFQAESFAQLIDAPIEIGQFEEFRFVSHDTPVYVIAHQPRPSPLMPHLVESCRRLCDAAGELFGGLPFRRYQFMFHFGFGPGENDGMAHAQSAQVVRSGELDDEAALRESVDAAARELFETMIAKSLRPIELRAPDLTREAYTRSLWVEKGIAVYYRHLLQLRAGIVDSGEFRRRIAELIEDVEALPARDLMSLEDASLATWAWERRNPRLGESDQSNHWVDYEAKGAVLAWLLDMRIRASSAGERGLDDVFRAMMADEELVRDGYASEDFEAASSRAAGVTLDSFFDRFARGRERLPYIEMAEELGFVIDLRKIDGDSDMGATVAGGRITGMRPDSPLALAGLQRYDEIEKIGGEPFRESLASTLGRLGRDLPRTITVRRRGEPVTLPFALGKRERLRCRYEESTSVTSKQRLLRESFYRGRGPE